MAARECDVGLGRQSLEQAVATAGIGDVLVHTWDLSRATGLDEALDADDQTRLIAFTGRRP